MAAQTWDEIVAKAQLSADERKLLDNVVQKLPELKDGGLRQSEFSRRLTELDARKTEYDEAVAYSGRMKTWADEKVPIWEDLVAQGVVDDEGKHLWKDREEGLKKQLEDAKALGGDVDPAKLNEIVNERVQAIIKDSGLKLNQAEVTALFQSEGKKMVEETFKTEYEKVQKDFNEKTIPFTTGFATSMAIMANKYEKETGEEFTEDTQKAVFEFMTKEKDFSPRSAVAKFMEPKLSAKKAAAEIEEKAQKRAQEILKERGGLPGGGDEPYIPPPGQAKGSLRQLLDESAKPEGDIESLAMAGARKAASELRAEGKF